MIEINCDACEQAFVVDEEHAGGKLPCPHCGDINRIPATAVATAATVVPIPAAADAPGPGSEPEKEIAIVRPGMFRAHPFRYLLILLLVVGGVVLAIMAKTSEAVWPWMMWAGLVVATVGLLWWAIWWMSTHWWVKLIVTNKRSIRHEGIIHRHTTEVLHDHVRSVDINQTFMERIFGVGHVGIDSAGQDGIEIEIGDIPKPYAVKKIIDQYRRM